MGPVHWIVLDCMISQIFDFPRQVMLTGALIGMCIRPSAKMNATSRNLSAVATAIYRCPVNLGVLNAQVSDLVLLSLQQAEAGGRTG